MLFYPAAHPKLLPKTSLRATQPTLSIRAENLPGWHLILEKPKTPVVYIAYGGGWKVLCTKATSTRTGNLFPRREQSDQGNYADDFTWDLAGALMAEQRKYAVLFAATILSARKLMESMEDDKPNMAKQYWVEKAIREAEFILERVENRRPTEERKIAASQPV